MMVCFPGVSSMTVLAVTVEMYFGNPVSLSTQDVNSYEHSPPWRVQAHSRAFPRMYFSNSMPRRTEVIWKRVSGRVSRRSSGQHVREGFVWITAFSWAPVVRFGSMNGSLSCRVEQLSSAKPAAIYDLLMDVERWPDWMPNMSAASWERRGEPDTGRGGIRRMRIGLSVIRDTIVDGTRPHHQAYVASHPWYFG